MERQTPQGEAASGSSRVPAQSATPCPTLQGGTDVCVLLFQSQRCLSCSMSQVLPSVQVDNLGAIRSKETATPQDTSAASLAYLGLQAPPEQTDPLGPTVASAFPEEMVETAGKGRKVKREPQVTDDEAVSHTPLPPHSIPPPPPPPPHSLLLHLMGIAPKIPSLLHLHQS